MDRAVSGQRFPTHANTTIVATAVPQARALAPAWKQAYFFRGLISLCLSQTRLFYPLDI